MMNDFIYKKPEEEGLSSNCILKFIERLKDRKVNLHSFLIARNGNILTEAYYKPFDEQFMHRLYSSSKTYVAMAVGLLIGEGKLRLDDKLLDYFPEYADGTQDEWLKNCTVEDALKMSVPMRTDTYFNLDYKEWAWTFFHHPTRSQSLKPAGTVFDYNTSGSFILDVLVERITQKPFLEYMRPLFDKIGVGEIKCVQSPDGYSWGGSGVICTLRDFAKFGELLLNKGNYKGEQLIPLAYMQRATSKQISNVRENQFSMRHEYGYGYQTWITKHGYAMLGMGSQFAFCFPDKNFLFVCQGDTQSNADADGDYIYEQVVYELYEQLDRANLSDNETYEKLTETLENLLLNVDYGAAYSPFATEINGVKYELKENELGWKWFALSFEKDGGKLLYENARGVKEIVFGLNAFKKGKFPETHYYDMKVMQSGGREFDCIADGSWTEEKKFLLRVYIVDNSLGNCFMTFGFKGDEVGVMLYKRAEFFMEDYCGFAGGKRVI
ncbi:MAG: serine hydrolase [Clostridia bacterium]|nr:serine hydrolase [Clostridia bacterium]